jgi:hypothetical protein
MCELLWPRSAAPVRGSAASVKVAVRALERECDSGFGRRGEFGAYAPFLSAKVEGVETDGSFGSVRVRTSRGAGTLAFLRVAGRWRLLVTTN